MAFDTGRTGKVTSTATEDRIFRPGVPYDAIQFVLKWTGGAGDSLAILGSPDGGSTYVTIPGSPWTPASDAVIQTAARMSHFKLSYTKAVGNITVFIDAVEFNGQQSKELGTYTELANNDCLKQVS